MGGVKHTVIVPAYNTGEAIRRCIDSILAQSIGDWELIVVDDGSSDCTPVVIDEYAGKDERIRAIHIANGGVSNARNVGLEAARGEYVMFVDSDDWIEPDYLREVEACMGDDADIYMLGISLDYTGDDGGVYYSEIKGAPVHRKIGEGDVLDNVGYLIKTMNMESSCLKSYRRRFLEENGIQFVKGMIVFEDFYFVLSCLMKRPRVSTIPYIGYHYVVDMEYNPSARRGGRDLYPSVHRLFVALDELCSELRCGSYSREIILRTMADKLRVVLGQCTVAKTCKQKKLPFKQIHDDEILRKHQAEILGYAGGRYRLQHRCVSAGFPMLAYVFYRLLR